MGVKVRRGEVIMALTMLAVILTSALAFGEGW